MPSTLLGYPLASGPQPLVSGCPWSGLYPEPFAFVNLKLDTSAGGRAYVCLSGGVSGGAGNPHLNSGGTFLSGSGLLDGYLMSPGDVYQVARRSCSYVSGQLSIFAYCDAAASGVARMYWEAV
jgi:hypothetical protein